MYKGVNGVFFRMATDSRLNMSKKLMTFCHTFSREFFDVCSTFSREFSRFSGSCGRTKGFLRKNLPMLSTRTRSIFPKSRAGRKSPRSTQSTRRLSFLAFRFRRSWLWSNQKCSESSMSFSFLVERPKKFFFVSL